MNNMNENENRLIAHDTLDPEKISSLDYTNTLVAEAFRAGLFTEEDVTRIQLGLMQVLTEVIGYYSSNKSTSVQTERAKCFGQSILFNIDIHLLTLADHRAAAEELRTKSLSDLYARGYGITKKKFEQAKVLYARARYTRPRTASAEYNKTLDIKLKNYFDTFDPRFTAHARAYLTLRELNLRGAYRIDQLPSVLQKMIDANTGSADVVL